MPKSVQFKAPRRPTPGTVERQRLEKIAEHRRAVQQEKRLASLGRQLRAAIVKTQERRQVLLEALAQELGYTLVAADQPIAASR